MGKILCSPEGISNRILKKYSLLPVNYRSFVGGKKKGIQRVPWWVVLSVHGFLYTCALVRKSKSGQRYPQSCKSMIK